MSKRKTVALFALILCGCAADGLPVPLSEGEPVSGALVDDGASAPDLGGNGQVVLGMCLACRLQCSADVESCRKCTAAYCPTP